MWRAVTGAGGGGRRRRPFHCPRSRIPSQQKQGSGGGRAGLSVDLALAGLRRVAAASDWASAFLEKRAFFFFSSSFLSSDVGGNSLEARPRLRIPAFPGLSLRSARLSLSLSLSLSLPIPFPPCAAWTAWSHLVTAFVVRAPSSPSPSSSPASLVLLSRLLQSVYS